MQQKTSMRSWIRRRQAVALAVAATGAVVISSAHVRASVLVYNGATDGTGPGWNASGGVADWLSGTVATPWSNSASDTALFNSGIGATSGAVSVTSPVNVGVLQFNASGYVLAGAAINLSVGSQAAPNIILKTGASATINSAIVGTTAAGSDGLDYNGSTTSTLTLGGANTFTGITAVDLGTLTYAGQSSSSGGGNLYVNGTGGAGTTTTVNINSAGTFSFGTIVIGTGGNGSGFLNLNAGTTSSSAGITMGKTGGTPSSILVTNASGTGTTNLTVAVNNGFLLGSGATTTCSLIVSDGGVVSESGTGGLTVASNATSNSMVAISGSGVIGTSGNALIGGGGRGALYQSGGTVNAGGTTAVGSLSGAIGVADISGGTFNISASALRVGDAGTGSLSVRTAGVVKAPLGLTLSNIAGGVGVVNLLDGGAINTKVIAKGSGTSSTFNFNGGTLAPVAGATTAFMTGLTNAYVYGGGAVIDTTAANVTIGQSLLAPTGNGVSGITFTAGTGTGYTVAPIVQITGGGTNAAGATAVANLNSSGTVTGFTITNPGVNYTSAPVVTLYGNALGATVVAGATAATADNTTSEGGLTKTGANTLTLTGANTYTGLTTVSAGTLRVNGSTLPEASGGTVSIASGATLGGNGSVGAVTVSGKITAGVDDTSVGNLSTGTQTWSSNGTFQVKFSSDNSTNDRLVMSSLSYAPGTPFTIDLTGTAISSAVGTFILAVDKASGGNADPFLKDSLSLTIGGLPAPDRYTLSERQDANISDGVDLIVTAAAPEPTSLILAALAAAPLLGRRSRRKLER